MFQHFSRPFPNWYVEGFAELIGTPSFGKDGSVTVGIAPKHRAFGLFANDGLTFRQLLVDQPKNMTDVQRESIYARGWLLSHYLTFDPARRGQLQKYFDALAAGKPMAAAANETFGDLKLLDKELGQYLKRRTLLSINVAARGLAIGPINVQPLSAGAEEALPWQMRSKRGVNEQTSPQVAERLRVVAARHPHDPFVQGALAEAEFDVKRYDLAIATADMALKADLANVQAMVWKGRALMEQAGAGKPTLVGEARKLFIAANKIDAEDPEPLYLFFQSYVRAGSRPTANALAALHYASALAPSDEGVRMTSAVAYLNERKPAEARAALLPIAYDPHAGDLADGAREAINLIDGGKADAALTALLAERPPKPRTNRR